MNNNIHNHNNKKEQQQHHQQRQQQAHGTNVEGWCGGSPYRPYHGTLAYMPLIKAASGTP